MAEAARRRTWCPKLMRAPRTRLRYDGRSEPGPMGHSALRASTVGETGADVGFL
jgi:hypothetical protein